MSIKGGAMSEYRPTVADYEVLERLSRWVDARVGPAAASEVESVMDMVYYELTDAERASLDARESQDEEGKP